MGLMFPAAATQVSLDLDDRAIAYMPFGFIQFAEYQLGNGDYFGLYWPIGREAHPPLVAETFHDEGALKPAFSSLDAFLALTAEIDSHPDFPTIEQDPGSPLACCDAARLALRGQDLVRAVALLESAVAILPQFTEALALLTAQYQRLGRLEDACRMAVRTLMSPPSFGNEQRVHQMTRWLSRQGTGPQDLARDPLWQARTRLAVRPGGGSKTNDAYPILADAIDIYEQRGQIVEALTLMQTYIEFMNRETVSFQERYGFTHAAFHQRQREVSKRLPDGPRFVAVVGQTQPR